MFFQGNEKYNCATYLRLSRSDGDQQESNSIKNQRALLNDYMGKHPELHKFDEYVDDGYSGTNFERPDFKRMMQDIEKRNVNCIIVKDLSRFGRNYIETGRYLERIFPFMGVRFIAINDHYDSAEENDDKGRILIPFNNLINDTYCRDISLRVRSHLDVKRKEGQFIGSFAGYGYRKDPKDKNHLIIDEYAAGIVQEIFKSKLNGMSSQRIASHLNELGVLPPNEYKRANGFNYTCGFQAGLNQKWTVVSVNRILKNESYTGTLIQGKRRKINYKVKKSHDVGSENWIRVEDAHDAIISKGEFQQVQQLLELDTRTAPSQTTVYPLSGFLRCADCGQNMIRRTVTKNGKKYQYYHCSTYKNGGDCTPHMINSEKLTESVLAAIRHQVTLLVEAEKVLSNAELASGEQIGIKILDSQITALEAELERYSNLKIRLYQDLCDDVVSREEYGEMNNHLSGMVYCGCCRRNMTFERRVHGTVKETHYGVFICKRKKNTTPCAYHAVPEKMLMMVAMDQIHHLVSTMCEEEKLVKDMMRGSNLDSARSIKMKENSILFRIQEAEERRLRLYEDYKAEILDEDEYSQLKEHYIAEKQRLEHELQKQRQRALELEKRIKICDAQMERMRGILNQNEFDEELVHELIKRIYVGMDNSVEVEFKCGDPYQEVLAIMSEVQNE